MSSLSDPKANEIFQGQVLLYRHIFAFLDSMCLKWCAELGIPNIIHNHGQPITLHELVSALQVPPAKIGGVERLMQYLAHNGFFDIVRIHDNQEEKEAYALTVASQLLVRGTDHCLSPMLDFTLDPTFSGSFHQLRKWIYEEDLTLFEISLGTSLWDFLNKNFALMSSYNEAMAGDSQMVKLALRDHSLVFEGLESIVDVGGGTGTTARIVSETFPKLKCIVFDRPQVVENLSGSKNLSYVGGDMFESIPKANAVLIKSVLHDWDDDHCIKILKKCKDALFSNDKNGKIIIIETVINGKQDEHEATQVKLKLDITMASVNGKERDAREWKKLLIASGFRDCKISPFTGYLSLIEADPEH